MDHICFDTYIETQLASTLSPRDVVILDNLAVHKSAKVARVLKERKAWFLFPPPDSPDLNPIEMAFSKKRACVPQPTEPSKPCSNALASICNLFDRTKCRALFQGRCTCTRLIIRRLK